ncbi:hypothetical protein U14_00065 [Candidatus Moduliflexus flocculans]|uniref:Uncharacterized protein n=1 Tax=Candidatus Moduliflexus flocculans TaxID=1499966 RepID=A0A0S6VV39_9BACT|nr:hypothetical protein U14_00065 [Candidatus Moduliflexus flocculans]
MPVDTLARRRRNRSRHFPDFAGTRFRRHSISRSPLTGIQAAESRQPLPMRSMRLRNFSANGTLRRDAAECRRGARRTALLMRQARRSVRSGLRHRPPCSDTLSQFPDEAARAFHHPFGRPALLTCGAAQQAAHPDFPVRDRDQRRPDTISSPLSVACQDRRAAAARRPRHRDFQLCETRKARLAVGCGLASDSPAELRFPPNPTGLRLIRCMRRRRRTYSRLSAAVQPPARRRAAPSAPRRSKGICARNPALPAIPARRRRRIPAADTPHPAIRKRVRLRSMSQMVVEVLWQVQSI